MFKSIKIFLALVSLLSFNYSAMAYALQFADAPKTIRLNWKKGKIQIALSTSLKLPSPSILPQSDVEGAISRSLETWEKAADIKFETVWVDKQSISPVGNYGDGISLITIAQTPDNLILFGDKTDEISAQTRTFYTRKGFISEADVVLNPYQQFSTDGTIGTYDLESTLTHEIGHLLGLEHSTIMGATMHARQSKNGIYNLSSFASRTLAEDDIAGIRTLYNAKNIEDDCCGMVAGKVIQAKSKTTRNFQVWAENADSGQVAAGALTNPDGSFRLEGLKAGIYRFYAQDSTKNGSISAEELGAFEVIKGKTTSIIKRLRAVEGNFSIHYAGFNGQISDLAVPLNGGKSYQIYIGGKNLNAENLTIGSNSPHLNITPESITKLDYGTDVSVLSFELKIDADTPNGEYSLFVQSQNGSKHYLLGGLTIENFVNPWSTYVLPTTLK